MRTGQAHRTLTGHSGPITCLQFDESYIISGSLDKTIKVCLSFSSGCPCDCCPCGDEVDDSWFCIQTWDLRTGSAVETLRYDYPVTALQFDTRKIVACTGENGVDVSGFDEQTDYAAGMSDDTQSCYSCLSRRDE